MKLSIIIPVYNKQRYLPGLLERLREQTFSEYECLLIDDGSTDGSGAVCDEFAARDARFQVFHIPNGGVSHARNVGLDKAHGEYVTFIDSDDSILPDYLENLVRCIETSGADLVISGFEKVTADGAVARTVVPCKRGTWTFQDLLPEFVAEQKESGIFGYCFAKIFSRKLVSNIRFDESLKLAEDLDFYLNLYEIIETIFLDDHTGYLYLQEAENSTGNTASEKIDYLAQLRINLHYRAMLQKRGVYSGKNREILEGRLCDYAFFVLFHTPAPFYQERFQTLYDLCRQEHIVPKSGKIMGKWLFFCLRHHQCIAARLTMGVYRFARKLRRGL